MLPECRALTLGLLVLASLGLYEAEATGSRHKRYVAFRKGSTFFYRVNYKVNTLPYTTLFAQASGFKIAWELPTGRPYRKGRSVSPDDIRAAGEMFYDSGDVNGNMCLLKSLCQATIFLREKDGVFRKILDLLSSSYSANSTSSLDPFLCKNYSHLCPFQLAGFNFFTES